MNPLDQHNASIERLNTLVDHGALKHSFLTLAYAKELDTSIRTAETLASEETVPAIARLWRKEVRILTRIQRRVYSILACLRMNESNQN
jgi:hypothetical protein